MNFEQMTLNKQTVKKVKTYSFEEAYKESLTYFDGDELAARVWVNKYALKDSFGNIYEKSPKEMHIRIAKEIERMERKYPNPMKFDEIFSLLDHFKYIVPAGSPMSGIGNKHQIVSLSNCFVIGHENPADSYGGILRMDEEQVQLMKRRGGVGHDLSHIRPKGSPVMNSALSSTGVVPFMERYSNSTREVAQDGRRGALMLSISIKHPDAENFIDAKLESGKITGANISVKIDDKFMKAVANDDIYIQQYPIDSDNPTFTKKVKARQLWEKIYRNAWKSAEPGILFWDTVLNESVADSYAHLGYRTVSTNPCGEIPLCPYDSCRLLAINLYSYIEKPFTSKATFNWDKFQGHVQKAQRFMDDIIDLELEKIDRILEKIDKDPEDPDIKHVERTLWQKIKDKAENGRRTGVGITAEGDMLAALNLRYGTQKASDFATEVHKNVALNCYRSSVTMAQERGKFPIYDSKLENNNPFILRIKKADPDLYKDMTQYGRGNISLLTIAPTGSTSIMTQTTSGIEPVFMPVYRRRRKVNPNDKSTTVSFVDETGDAWEEYNVFHPHFLTWMKVAGFDTNLVKHFSDEEINALIEKSPYYKATSNDVDWLEKVRMQGTVQQWIDHSISVTINLPKDVKPELVGELYQEAWRSGCKGATVYRDGSRDGVLLSKKKEPKKDEIQTTHSPKRPKELECNIVRFKNDEESWIAFVGVLNGRPYEIFTGLDESEALPISKSVKKGVIIKNREESGKSRYDLRYTNKYGYNVIVEGLSYKFSPEFWNYAKLISGILRHGMPIEHVLHLIEGLHLNDATINTWKNGVERALKPYISNGTKAVGGETCSACGSSNLIYQEGCLSCQDCGNSKCG